MQQGASVYLRGTLGFLAGLYTVAMALLVLSKTLTSAAVNIPFADKLLRAISIIGPLRRAMAMSRFCATYDLQLDAGVNVMQSLYGAANASQSGLVRRAIARSLPQVRLGHQVGPLLAKSGAFPATYIGYQIFLTFQNTVQQIEQLFQLAQSASSGWRRSCGCLEN